MKKLILSSLIIFGLFGSKLSVAAEDHGDHDHEEEPGHDEKAGHDDDHDHKDGDSHGEEAEESSGVGPEKGITEKSKDGFKLSSEAFKTMDIQTKAFTGAVLSIDKKTLVLVKDEKSVFRLRDGWILRVPVQILSKTSSGYTISSASLKSGDQVVTEGMGFLRIAEVFASEGASHGHSH